MIKPSSKLTAFRLDFLSSAIVGSQLPFIICTIFTKKTHFSGLKRFVNILKG